MLHCITEAFACYIDVFNDARTGRWPGKYCPDHFQYFNVDT